MRGARLMGATICAAALALPAVPAAAGEFTVQICQQRTRTLAGLPGIDVAPGQASATQDCAPGGGGVAITPPLSMAFGTVASATLQPKGGGRIVRALIWHDSTVTSPDLSLQLVAVGEATSRPLAAASGPAAELGGADQAAIGPTFTGGDFADAPVARIDYRLTCNALTCDGTGPAATLRIYGAQLTIDDSTAPVIDRVDQPRVATGPVTTVVHARDTVGGVRGVQLVSEGQVLGATTRTCDQRAMQPCPAADDVPVTWDSSVLGDGTHPVIAQVIDAGNNATTVQFAATTDNQAPVVRAAPSIASSPVIGTSTSVLEGTLGSVPTSVSFQWMRCGSLDAGSCADIPGAADRHYTPTLSDERRFLRVREAATDAGGTSLTVSDASDPVRKPRLVALGPPFFSSAAADAATPRVGDIVRVDPGTWRGVDIDFSYAWSRCTAAGCTPVPKASTPAYVMTDDDVGHSLAVDVTATDVAGTEATVSARTGTVRRELLMLLPPRIAGRPTPGAELEATRGFWIGDHIRYSWQWRRCRPGGRCRPIPSATTPTYRVSAQDRGHTLEAVLTATDGHGKAVSRGSDLVGPVANTGLRTLPHPSVDFDILLPAATNDGTLRVDRMTVGHLRRGSRVAVICREFCGRPPRVRETRTGRGDATKAVLRFSPQLRLGDSSAFDVLVTAPGYVGWVWRYSIREVPFLGVSYDPRLLCRYPPGRIRRCARG